MRKKEKMNTVENIYNYDFSDIYEKTKNIASDNNSKLAITKIILKRAIKTKNLLIKLQRELAKNDIDIKELIKLESNHISTFSEGRLVEHKKFESEISNYHNKCKSHHININCSAPKRDHIKYDYIDYDLIAQVEEENEININYNKFKKTASDNDYMIMINKEQQLTGILLLKKANDSTIIAAVKDYMDSKIDEFRKEQEITNRIFKTEIGTINEETGKINEKVTAIGTDISKSAKQVKDQSEKSNKINECMFIALAESLGVAEIIKQNLVKMNDSENAFD